MRGLDPEVRDAYLARLGLERDGPSVDGLRMLHRRHAELVPYETLWIHGGESWTIDPHEAARRIAVDRRGGYCYHLNGAFWLLLQSLGYAVHRHAGGVHGPDGPNPAEPGNHLVLTVTDLPSDDNPVGSWYVDVGLGDALHEPMPLATGAVQQGPFRLELSHVQVGIVGDWHLHHDPAGGFTGMVWTAGPADDELLAKRHEWLSTSPESGFVKLGSAQTRDEVGVDVVHGLVVKRVGAEAHTAEPLTDRGAWFGALADLFDLTFTASPPGTADRLWERTVVAHRAWEASQR